MIPSLGSPVCPHITGAGTIPILYSGLKTLSCLLSTVTICRTADWTRSPRKSSQPHPSIILSLEAMSHWTVPRFLRTSLESEAFIPSRLLILASDESGKGPLARSGLLLIAKEAVGDCLAAQGFRFNPWY